jgi:hypothetical protein
LGYLLSGHPVLRQPNITKKHEVSVKETEGTIANSLFKDAFFMYAI